MRRKQITAQADSPPRPMPIPDYKYSYSSVVTYERASVNFAVARDLMLNSDTCLFYQFMRCACKSFPYEGKLGF